MGWRAEAKSRRANMNIGLMMSALITLILIV